MAFTNIQTGETGSLDMTQKGAITGAPVGSAGAAGGQTSQQMAAESAMDKAPVLPGASGKALAGTVATWGTPAKPTAADPTNQYATFAPPTGNQYSKIAFVKGTPDAPTAMFDLPTGINPVTGKEYTEQDMANAGYQLNPSGPAGMADAVDGGAGANGDGEKKAGEGVNVQQPEKIIAPNLQAEKDRLEASRKSQLDSLAQSHLINMQQLRKDNKNLGNSLKARLIKLGIKPSDSAWSNAEAGQLERDQFSEAKANAEYNANVAKINAGMDEKITQIATSCNFGCSPPGLILREDK